MKFLIVLISCIAGVIGAPLTPEQKDIWSNHNNHFQNAEFQMYLLLQNNYQRLFPQIAPNDNVGFSKKARDVINFLTESFYILGQVSLNPDVVNKLSKMLRELGINKNDFCEYRIAMTSFLKNNSHGILTFKIIGVMSLI